jgi:hypothetical protein
LKEKAEGSLPRGSTKKKKKEGMKLSNAYDNIERDSVIGEEVLMINRRKVNKSKDKQNMGGES